MLNITVVLNVIKKYISEYTILICHLILSIPNTINNSSHKNVAVSEPSNGNGLRRNFSL